MSTAEVIDVVTSRLHRDDGPGCPHADGARVALVIEGGGMRGIVSAAMACVLEELGILSVVDLVIGTSSGGVNAAAAARGVIGPFAAAYADVFSAREFIDVRRLLTGRPVVDSPHIVRHLDHLYDLGQLAGPPAGLQLALVATDVGSAEAVALTGFTSRSDVLGAIHASGLLPLLGGPPISLRGRRWLDGGIVEPVPVSFAQQLGATHAIVLATRPDGHAPSFGPIDRLVLRYLAGLNPLLASQYRQRPERYRRTLAQAASGTAGGLPTLLLQPPAGAVLPSRLERNPGRLRAANHFSRDEAMRQLARHRLAS